MELEKKVNYSKVPPIKYPFFDIEKEILIHKNFYSSYLLKVKKKDILINDLLVFQKSLSVKYSMLDKGTLGLIEEISLYLKLNINVEILKLFDKEIAPQLDTLKTNESKIVAEVALLLISGFAAVNNRNIETLNHRKQFLKLLIDCLTNNGLHSYISLRSDFNNRFNLLVEHKLDNKSKTTSCQILLSKEELANNFIKLYKSKKPIKLNGRIIPFSKIELVKITVTKLKDDELILFCNKHQIEWKSKVEDCIGFTLFCDDVTDNYQPNPYQYNVSKNEIETSNLYKVFDYFEKYPKSKVLLESAYEKLSENFDSRSLLDDLRLSLETFLKEKFDNKKSLEKQKDIALKFLNERGSSKEVINLFYTTFDYYIKFQNENVKHDNVELNQKDILYIFDLTLALIKLFF
jgi:hypothetical protein